MEITSNHLERIDLPVTGDEGAVGEAGEELSKRGERFGWPVGKGACFQPHLAFRRSDLLMFCIKVSLGCLLYF